jgi:probable selenium-dependent hydroxylase accessory protein YqeC
MASLRELFSPQHSFQDGACVALLGGGGKSTLQLQLGRMFAEHWKKVLLTSRTRAAASRYEQVVYLEDRPGNGIANLYQDHIPLCVMNRFLNERKLEGVSEEQLQEMVLTADVCVCENDGARNLPIKAHNTMDPIVSDAATHVVILVGADALGATLESGFIHRPELFGDRWNLNPSSPLTAQLIADVVTSEEGYMQKVRNGQLVAYLVNKADRFPDRARELADAIAERSVGHTSFGSIREGWIEQVN